MADYYCCPVETAMRSVLPQVIRDAEVDAQDAALRPARPPADARGTRRARKRAPRQAEVLAALWRRPARPLPVAALAKRCGATHQTIQALVKAGFVETAATAVGRDPYEKETFVANAQETLTDEQAAALRIVHAALDAPAAEKRPVLLFGVTGSGKTEVYLQGIARALERGQTALVLVPEISPDAADGRALQEPLFAARRTRSPCCTATFPTASGTTNGTRSTAARRASSSARARRCSRRCPTSA